MLIYRPLLEGEQGGGNAAAGNQGGGQSDGGQGQPWYAGLPDPVKSQIEAKGFKDVSSLATSYFELEKMRGVPADRLLTMPDKPDSPDWENFYKKIGRPEKPEGYDVKVPTGQSDEFAKWARGLFHSTGLTKKQGDAIAAKWNEYQQQIAANSTKAGETARAEQISKLKQEWGAAAVQNGEIVDKFLEAAGVDQKTIDAIDSAIGYDAFSKLVFNITQKFGIQMGEAGYKAGNQNGSFSHVLSPGAALEKIKELKSDREWVKSWSSGDKDKKKEMDTLYSWAYPTAQQ